ncbi:uncharacterized protein K452DRAFT_341048 [Aplosporella prunicola CBS 121167]|uniref:DUF6594 domain-containing protein n=1 Tax=Aplosporella prunicola CBS 121167 TaxID=1176127 RepID=A0A6A6BUR4_9PEZI|nr:uncharacterized protein K452DRAFT_341048 [Aplosporella prunicola CBS 121167]KAF2146401.1 hypothetical protein K452DRAFT_341048 [Aplosporella prunicola CBS 121167]
MEDDLACCTNSEAAAHHHICKRNAVSFSREWLICISCYVEGFEPEFFDPFHMEKLKQALVPSTRPVLPIYKDSTEDLPRPFRQDSNTDNHGENTAEHASQKASSDTYPYAPTQALHSTSNFRGKRPINDGSQTTECGPSSSTIDPRIELHEHKKQDPCGHDVTGTQDVSPSMKTAVQLKRSRTAVVSPQSTALRKARRRNSWPLLAPAAPSSQSAAHPSPEQMLPTIATSAICTADKSPTEQSKKLATSVQIIAEINPTAEVEATTEDARPISVQTASLAESLGPPTTWDDVPAGYPMLAKRMADMPTASIFRSFAALNLQNLLYMQAELQDLEKELLKLQAKDAAAGNESIRRRNYARDWWSLQRSGIKGRLSEDDPIQWRVAVMIRDKLQKYNEALIQMMKILSAKEPDEQDYKSIQEFLVSKPMLDGEALVGGDRDIWGVMNENYQKDPEDDLITLLSREKTDRLSRWITSLLVKRLDKKANKKENKENDPRKKRGSVVAFSVESINRWTFMLTTGLGAMLPVASMLALQRLESVQVRTVSLVWIAAFNFFLAILLHWLASVKRAEIFAIASAFAAVNVVFIAK